MELVEAIKQRRSIRRYSEQPVPDELLTEILQLAREAPSAGNLRAYKVIMADRQLTRYTAPINLVICAMPEKSAKRYGERGRRLYAIQDATIYGAYIQLIATNFGVDSVWVGAFRESKIRQALELDEALKPIAIILLGYRG